ncbi:MAG TPA: DUF4197 domain-containing protein [Steroidobacteraceae bacterium]|jgi:hypothetical protein|nr:DUF4197 domain-containing protein [Steroidobacteraceae bacterium]
MTPAEPVDIAAPHARIPVRRARTATFLLTAALSFAFCAAALGDVASLSNTDASAGLKKALDQGIDSAVGKLGVTDGFLKNPAVRIDLPPKLAKAEGLLRTLGAGREIDELVTAMNRAAEAAVPESKTLLKQALRQMTLEDAKRILTGKDDAATQYFKQATYSPLKIKFEPVVKRTTQKVKLSETYDALAGKAVALGVLKPEDASIESYVTDRALDGLFTMMAEEERAIRKDPLGQASSLLKRVFGALR